MPWGYCVLKTQEDQYASHVTSDYLDSILHTVGSYVVGQPNTEGETIRKHMMLNDADTYHNEVFKFRGTPMSFEHYPTGVRCVWDKRQGHGIWQGEVTPSSHVDILESCLNSLPHVDVDREHLDGYFMETIDEIGMDLFDLLRGTSPGEIVQLVCPEGYGRTALLLQQTLAIYKPDRVLVLRSPLSGPLSDQIKDTAVVIVDRFSKMNEEERKLVQTLTQFGPVQVQEGDQVTEQALPSNAFIIFSDSTAATPESFSEQEVLVFSLRA